MGDTERTIGPAPAIVFADMAGVLARNDTNRGRAIDRLIPERVAHLNNIVASTGALVVVSSSWREVADPSQLTSWLRAAGFKSRVHDVTPIFEPSNGFADGVVRAREIESWLAKQPVAPTAIAILDDVWIGGSVSRYLVQTNEHVGLTAAHAERAIQLLGVVT